MFLGSNRKTLILSLFFADNLTKRFLEKTYQKLFGENLPKSFLTISETQCDTLECLTDGRVRCASFRAFASGIED